MDEKAKQAAKERREKVLCRPKSAFDLLPENEKASVDKCSAGYRAFSDNSKTERNCVDYCVELAKSRGFVEYKRGMALKPGDRIYKINRSKALALSVIGTRPPDDGLNIVAAHIDVPRIDLKTNPLYEDAGLAYFKTHYYGGIKKYQWVAIPLELHGAVGLKDGSVVRVSVGADAGDPVLTITDLLPHLSTEQYRKSLAEAIPGENLNVLLGCQPAENDEGEDRVRLAVMELLYNKYGIIEQDLASSELSLVPAFNSRDVGIDASMIGAYGHDDRVCSYTSLAAILEMDKPSKTAICMLADKEEIGSEGVTGMKSAFFDTFVEDVCCSLNSKIRHCFENSRCLSADVCAAFDPNFPDAYDKRNSPRLGYGVGICKYTGSRGKSGASDASAELVALVRRILDDNGVCWQMAPMGKVDLGGGGTVAMFMAERNIDTIDIGVPVLSMHSPFEIVSKLDTYMAYKAFLAFYKSE